MPRLFAYTTLFGALLVAAQASAASLTYRGSLSDQGQPANGQFDLKFALYDGATSSKTLAPDIVVFNVSVRNGAFEVPLEVSDALAAVGGLHAALAVRVPGAQTFETLPNRVQIKALGGVCWNTDGNGALGAGSYLGTTDAVPLELRTNNARVGQMIGYAPSPSVVFGSPQNSATVFAAGASIGGGGGASVTDANFGLIGPNRVTDGFGTVAGGARNIAGNSIVSVFDAPYATVGGGQQNTASGAGSTIGGGGRNIASGTGATVPGGTLNTASGNNSIAAGLRAKAVHDGAMVFADNTAADFSSTAANQMLVRANGGVGVNVNAPLAKMHIRGALAATDLNQILPNRGSELILEDTDAQLQLISQQSGLYSSTIALTDVGASGGGAETWFIYKRANQLSIGFGFGVGDSMATGVQQYDFGTNGTALKPGGGSWGVLSDRRLKHDIQPLTGALDQLLRLRGVRFEYNDDAIARGLTKAGPQIGFVAQEVAEVIPQWVGVAADGYEFISETGTSALMVEALRELDQRNKDLAKQNASLTARLDALEAAFKR